MKRPTLVFRVCKEAFLCRTADLHFLGYIVHVADRMGNKCEKCHCGSFNINQEVMANISYSCQRQTTECAKYTIYLQKKWLSIVIYKCDNSLICLPTVWEKDILCDKVFAAFFQTLPRNQISEIQKNIQCISRMH